MHLHLPRSLALAAAIAAVALAALSQSAGVFAAWNPRVSCPDA